MRLFLIYFLVELAVIVALVSTIGFGWTVLLVIATFVAGLLLAGSQVTKHLRRLQAGLTGKNPQAAATDSGLVALGSMLMIVPGLASSLVGALLLIPPTRAAVRPVATALAARTIGRRVPLITTVGATGYPTQGRGEYIDGEVIDVEDTPQTASDATPPVPPRLPQRPD